MFNLFLSAAAREKLDSRATSKIGARLLDRSGGRVSLTVAGKLFFKYAEETLEERKSIFTAIAETEHIPRGAIVVGANEGTCLHILPEVFAQFKRLSRPG